MPATFAHPAAVLPLRRFTPRWLDFTALVVGSTTPDFGYYVRQFQFATYAHSLPGTVLLCVPLGLLAYSLFRVLRAPLCYLLPEPHRSALLPLTSTHLRVTPAKLLAICSSVLLGAWTHTVADSFTHQTGWVVQRVPAMKKIVFRIGAADFPTHQLLQHTGSILGSTALVLAYVLWLRRQPPRARISDGRLSDTARIAIVATCALFALIVGGAAGWNATSAFVGYFRLRAFAFQTAIYGAQIFVPLVVVAALVLYQLRRGRSSSPDADSP